MWIKRLPLITAIVIVVMILGLIAGVVQAARLPQTVGDQETIVLGQTRFAPGSNSALRLVVRDTRNAAPIADADVVVSMQSANGEKVTLYEGQTNAQGVANVNFEVPAQFEGAPKLIVETRSQLGADQAERTVNLQRSFKVLLSTDKPLYQPGQVIHIRALAVSAFDLKPASGQVQMTITDAKGNKVFQKDLEASAYGIASADFQLADEVNTGNYKITAQLGDTMSERTVTVQHYVLPKFKVTLATDKPYYTPGEHVTGKLNADYFFGKPVQGGTVKLAGYVFDVQRQQVMDISGQTDDAGLYEFGFDLPPYFVGGLEAGRAQFILQAAVTDGANHTEQAGLDVPVAQSSIVIQAVPEAGVLKPGLENVIYVVTTYPDGAPAPCDVTLSLDGKTYTLQTGDLGLGTVQVMPQSSYAQLQITVRDKQGNAAQQSQDLYGESGPEYVLLRAERAAYRVGDAMRLDVFTSAKSGTVYIDVVREGQTVSTRAVDVKDGHAQTALDLGHDLAGTLTIHAYKILAGGQIVRDTRIALVDPANDLAIAIKPDRDTYRPGDTAQIDFQVGGPAALGLAVVDESVFALQEQDPGFAKLYFLLEKELMEPKYDLHGFTPAGALRPIDEPVLRQAQDDAAKAALAAGQAAESASGSKALFSLNVNSREEKMEHIYQLQAQMLGTLATVSLPLANLLPLGIIGLGLWSLKRDNILRNTLITSALVVVILVFLISLLPSPPWGGSSVLSKLGYYLGELFDVAGPLPLCVFPLGLIAFVGMVIYSWRARDSLLGAMLVMLVGYIVLLSIALFLAWGAADGLEEAVLIVSGIAYLSVPLIFLVRAAGFGVQKRALPALGTLGVSSVALLALLPVVFLSGAGASAPLAIQDQALAPGNVVPVELGRDFAQPLAALPTVAAREEKTATGSTQAAQPPRLRQYFPETLFWLPEAVTDDKGHLVLDIPLADSITTWRLSAIASAQDGRIGSGTAGLRVFQEFFIDLDLPVALTQNDEIAVPVAVYNYLPNPQDVKLLLKEEDWFELKDQAEKTLTIAANDVSVVYFRIKAIQFGRYTLTVTGLGAAMSDAIQKDVTVHPDGKRVEFAHSDRLEGPTSVAAPIPLEAIPGTVKLMVKVYPGVMSQIVEGLDAILQMPYGCFEQTSSTTYPNVLAMDYIKTTGKSTPEIQMKAEEYINLGYQRLTSFEVDGGGFSLFGDAPADRMLTAYGLQEFHDMSRVYQVDPAFIDRAAQWLMSQQDANGTWKNDRGIVHEGTWQKLGDDRLPVTAYIAWSLAEAGYGQEARVQQAIRYIEENTSKAQDPYVLALVANALAAAAPNDSATASALERLAAAAIKADGAAYWQSEIATMMGGRGQTGSIETTALAAYALIRAEAHPDVANAALTYIVRNKDPRGTWHSTQATVLSLKALLLSTLQSAEDVDATVTVSLNGGQEKKFRITRENYDVVQMMSFDDVSPTAANQVQLAVEGKGNLMYQVAGSYYVPWKNVTSAESGAEAVAINVTYDRTNLRVNDTVGVRAEVSLNAAGTAQQALIDLGVPPGFEVLAEDLQARIEADEQRPPSDESVRVKRYELTGRQILVYVQNLSSDAPLVLEYRLRARFPLIAAAPSSTAYDYYNPQVRGELAPVMLQVEE